MHFDTKIAIIVDQQLAVWQKANVTAFLISGTAALHADRKTVDEVLDKLRPHP